MNYRLQGILSLGMLLLPGIVFAHTLGTDMSPFLSGLLHPFLVPAHLICLIALGLLLGQQHPNRNLTALASYPVAILIGLFATELPITIKLEIAILTVATASGLLITVCPRLPVIWTAIASAFTGLLVGFDSAQQAHAGLDKLGAFIGVGLGLLIVPLIAMELADYFCSKAWQRISVRILGSWIAASAFLVLTLIFSTAKI